MVRFHVLVVDDHPMFRQAVCSLLKGTAYVESCYEAGNGMECLMALKSQHIDVVLLDINMPTMNGKECLKEIRQGWPDVMVYILSQYNTPHLVESFRNLGANGYLVKTTTGPELVEFFERVAADPKYKVYPETPVDMENHYVKLLSPRELDVLLLLAEDKSTREISELLSITIDTVQSHRKNAMHKLGVHHVAAAIQKINGSIVDDFALPPALL